MTIRDEMAKVISGAPFPSNKSLAKADAILDMPQIQALVDAVNGLSPWKTGYGNSMDWEAYNVAQKAAKAALAPFTEVRGK